MKDDSQFAFWMEE